MTPAPVSDCALRPVSARTPTVRSRMSFIRTLERLAAVGRAFA
jgi:hypothetical protein